MVKSVYDVSKGGELSTYLHGISLLNSCPETHPEYTRFSHLLEDGWIPGRKVVRSTLTFLRQLQSNNPSQDNSDAQYSSFRDNIPYMAILLVLHPLIRKAYGAFWRIDTYTQARPSTGANPALSQGLSPSAASDARLEHRISFDLGFAAIFLIALHGVSALKVFFILYVNFKIATQMPKTYVPAATWIFNIGILFANELGHGYPLAEVAALLLPSQTSAGGNVDPKAGWAGWIDSYGGLLPRWEILFNFTVLRSISFNLDYYWSLNTGSSPIEV